MKNLSTAQADVTFGTDTKTFSTEQLRGGVNLAAEFIDNPFVASFNRVLNEVGQKQSAETSMTKGFKPNFRQLRGPLAEDPEVLATIRRKLTEANDAAHAKVKAAVETVRYTLVISPRP